MQRRNEHDMKQSRRKHGAAFKAAERAMKMARPAGFEPATLGSEDV